MPRTTANNNTSKHDEIVEIASRLFYQQGFGATGIKQIIDEAGIAKGTFYTHFKSKEALGVEWLRTRHTQWNSWLRQSLQEHPSSTDKILATFSYLESWMKESEYRGCAFLNTMAETPDSTCAMRQQVVHHKNQLHTLFQTLVGEHFESSDLTDEKIKQTGSIIYILFEGALVEAQNFQDAWPIQTASEQVKSLLYSYENR